MADESLLGGAPAEGEGQQAQEGQQQEGAAGEQQQEQQQEGQQQAAEGQEGQEGEGKPEGKKDGEGEAEGPPEAYEWTAPEGFEGELDQEALGELEPIARELGLTNEQANKLLSVHANAIQRQQEQQQEQVTQTLEGWVKELKDDSEFGGANFDANVKTAQKALSAFGSPELTQLLNDTGLGSHPALVKAFHQIGKRISEDTMERGGSAGGARSIEERMYPNMAS